MLEHVWRSKRSSIIKKKKRARKTKQSPPQKLCFSDSVSFAPSFLTRMSTAFYRRRRRCCRSDAFAAAGRARHTCSTAPPPSWPGVCARKKQPQTAAVRATAAAGEIQSVLNDEQRPWQASGNRHVAHSRQAVTRGRQAAAGSDMRQARRQECFKLCVTASWETFAYGSSLAVFVLGHLIRLALPVTCSTKTQKTIQAPVCQNTE
jgi:hypothetical protein